jgi:hypothetical protein
MNDFPKYPTVWAGMGVGPHVNKKDYDKLWFYAKEHIAGPRNPCSCVPDGDDGTVAHLCHWHKSYFKSIKKKEPR